MNFARPVGFGIGKIVMLGVLGCSVATTHAVESARARTADVIPASSPSHERGSLFGSKPVSAEILASKRGGDGGIADMQLTGTVSGNQASNLTTGSNVINGGAFAGAARLSAVVQNSGNNVLIQNSTIVNLQLK